MLPARELLKFYSKDLRLSHAKTIPDLLSKNKSEKILKLYQEEYSEDEIAEILYGTAEKHPNFRKLKSRMLDKAAKIILSNIEQVKFRNKYDDYIFDIQRLLIVSQLLIIKDNRKIAEPLLIKAFKKAVFVQSTSHIIEIAHILCYTNSYNGKAKAVKYYSNVLKDQIIVYTTFLDLEIMYFDMLVELVDSSDYNESSRQKIKILFNKLKSVRKKIKTHSIELMFYRISMRYYHSIHDFNSLKIVCRQALSYLNSKPQLFQNGRAGEFSLNEMDSCLRLGQFAQGALCAERCYRYFIPYSTPWLVFNENYFLLAMRTSNFDKATEILDSLKSSRYQLNKMLKRQSEKWRIYEAFLFYSLNTDSGPRQFNLYKYLSDIDIFQKDKKGYNYTVIISKFLLLLNTDHIGELISLEDSFKNYFYKYIKSNEFPRHYIFGKFILKYFKKNFELNKNDIDIFIKNVKKYPKLEETEIIPYDILIKMIYDNNLLDLRKYKIII